MKKRVYVQSGRNHGREMESEQFIRDWLLTANVGQKMMVGFLGKYVTITVEKISKTPSA